MNARIRVEVTRELHAIITQIATAVNPHVPETIRAEPGRTAAGCHRRICHNSGMVRLVLSAIAALLALFLLGLASAAAQPQTNRSIVWERFDSTIDLLGDGTFRVVETQRVAFQGTYQRASRQIPLTRLASVTEVQVGEPGQRYRQGSNQPGTFTVSRSDDSIEINWWFRPTTNASRTFQVSYRVVGALRIYDAGDQLYWVAVPAERPGPVAAAEVLIRLPGDLPAEQLRAEGYLGGRPASGQSSIGGREVRYSGQRNLARRGVRSSSPVPARSGRRGTAGLAGRL